MQASQMLRLLQSQYLPNAWLPIGVRMFAAPAASAKKGGKDKGPRRPGTLSKTHATGCALMKGEQDPELKPDSEYPEWLWKLCEPQPTSKELTSRYQTQGLTVEQLQRLWRLKNKERIKEDNFLRAK